MRRICFYSDDSYKPCGDGLFHFVVAGVAIDGDKLAIREALLTAEQASGKGTTDWHSTKDPVIRSRYLELVLSIRSLTGRVFYGARDRLSPADYWEARLEVLALAVGSYSNAPCRYSVAHEGFTSNPREKLRRDLVKRGVRRLEITAGEMESKPEIRLVDALAGYIRGERFGGSRASSLFPNMPGWFVDLTPIPKNKTPRR